MPDRVEREVEEILAKLDNFVPEPPTPIRSPGRTITRARRNLTSRLPRISISWKHLLLWGLLIALVAYFFPGFTPGTFVVLGVLAIFIGYFMYSRRGSSAGGTLPPKRWRGQPLDLSGPSWTDKLKGKLKGGPRR